MTEQTWQDRYKRAVANFVAVPQTVPVEAITIDVRGEDGYYYSSYTFENPDIEITVRWTEGDRPRTRSIDGPERVAELIRSFISPNA